MKNEILDEPFDKEIEYDIRNDDKLLRKSILVIPVQILNLLLVWFVIRYFADYTYISLIAMIVFFIVGVFCSMGLGSAVDSLAAKEKVFLKIAALVINAILLLIFILVSFALFIVFLDLTNGIF